MQALVSCRLCQAKEPVDPIGVGRAHTCERGYLFERFDTDPVQPPIALEVETDIRMKVVIANSGGFLVENGCRGMHLVYVTSIEVLL